MNLTTHTCSAYIYITSCIVCLYLEDESFESKLVHDLTIFIKYKRKYYSVHLKKIQLNKASRLCLGAIIPEKILPFQDFLSHRILQYMHETLNISKK